MKEYFKFTPKVKEPYYRITFCSPKDYYLPKWIFDLKIYGELTWYIRICGLMIQKVWLDLPGRKVEYEYKEPEPPFCYSCNHDCANCPQEERRACVDRKCPCSLSNKCSHIIRRRK